MRSSRTARVALLTIVASLSVGGVAQALPPTGDADADGVLNRADPFALDGQNGAANRPGVRLDFNGDQGGFKGTGFSGLMTSQNPAVVLPDDIPGLVLSGGRLTINGIGNPDPVNDNSLNSLQFGLDANPARTDCFTVRSRIVAPFAGITPTGFQSMGVFVGRGDQDHYAKLVTQGGYGRGIESFGEYGTRVDAAGIVRQNNYSSVAAEVLPGPDAVDLYLRVDPDAGVIEPFYRAIRGGVEGTTIAVGAPVQFPDWFTSGPLAVGITSTSYVGGGSDDPRQNPFDATWEDLEVSQQCVRPTFDTGQAPTSTPTINQDRTPPRITNLRVSPSRFRTTGRASRRGGRVRMRLNEGARVRIRVERVTTGRRSASGRCVAPTRSNRSARRCNRGVLLRGVIARGARAGNVSVRFTGRIGNRRLRPNRYRVRVVAIDAAGNQSRVRTASFRVIR